MEVVLVLLGVAILLILIEIRRFMATTPPGLAALIAAVQTLTAAVTAAANELATLAGQLGQSEDPQVAAAAAQVQAQADALNQAVAGASAPAPAPASVSSVKKQ